MSSIDIVVADDHSLVRSGLVQLLQAEPGLRVIGEAADGLSLLRLLATTPAQLLVLDLSMPGLSGIDLVHRLRTEHPALPILMLTMHVEARLVARMLRAGVAGYVTKDCEPAILRAAVRKVAGGGRYIDPALVDSVVFQATQEAQENPHDLLSPREMQVLQRICSGQALGTIADELHLSPKTVSTHKMRLMQKLELETNADLLKYALRHGLTTS